MCLCVYMCACGVCTYVCICGCVCCICVCMCMFKVLGMYCSVCLYVFIYMLVRNGVCLCGACVLCCCVHI